MSEAVQGFGLACMIAVDVLTRNRAAKLGGGLVLALAVVFLLAAISDPSNRRSHLGLFLIGVLMALARWGVIPKTIAKSHLPYKIDGVIVLVVATVFLVLGIVFADERFYFVLSFLFLAPVGLGRLGVHPFTAWQ